MRALSLPSRRSCDGRTTFSPRACRRVATRWSTGVVSIDADLRKSYKEWAELRKDDQVATEGGFSMNRSKFLVGSTKRITISRWGALTAKLLLHDLNKRKQKSDNTLDEGEIRVEVNLLRLNKIKIYFRSTEAPCAQQKLLLFNRSSFCSTENTSVSKQKVYQLHPHVCSENVLLCRFFQG